MGPGGKVLPSFGEENGRCEDNKKWTYAMTETKKKVQWNESHQRSFGGCRSLSSGLGNINPR